jgi:hypothetical protein
MPKTISKDAALREIAVLYLRVENSTVEQDPAIVLAAVQRLMKALDGVRLCQRNGCQRPVRLRGKFCSDPCATTARSRRYRERKDATDSVTVEKYETLKLL